MSLYMTGEAENDSFIKLSYSTSEFEKSKEEEYQSYCWQLKGIIYLRGIRSISII